MRRSRWRFVPVVLLAMFDVWVLIAAAVALGAVGEERWGSAGRWGAVSGVSAVAALAALFVSWAGRPGAESAIAASFTGGAGALTGVLAFLFGGGSAVVGDWMAAGVSLIGLGAGALVALLAVVAWQRSRIRVLPPFQPLSPETFRTDVDPPAYPRPPALRQGSTRQRGRRRSPRQ